MKFNQVLPNTGRGRLGISLMLMVASLVTIMAPVRGDHASANVKLHDTAGQPVGVAKLTQEADGRVLVRVQVHDLLPGFHGFHVHAAGLCTPPFTTAGGHFNLGGLSHRDHAGDMPVLLVNADGTGEARFTTDRFAVTDRTQAIIRAREAGLGRST